MTPTTDRAAEVARRLKAAGISKAEAARRIGYASEAGAVYVRAVLGGRTTSAPVLDAIERAVLAPETPATT